MHRRSNKELVPDHLAALASKGLANLTADDILSVAELYRIQLDVKAVQAAHVTGANITSCANASELLADLHSENRHYLEILRLFLIFEHFKANGTYPPADHVFDNTVSTWAAGQGSIVTHADAVALALAQHQVMPEMMSVMDPVLGAGPLSMKPAELKALLKAYVTQAPGM